MGPTLMARGSFGAGAHEMPRVQPGLN